MCRYRNNPLLLPVACFRCFPFHDGPHHHHVSPSCICHLLPCHALAPRGLMFAMSDYSGTTIVQQYQLFVRWTKDSRPYTVVDPLSLKRLPLAFVCHSVLFTPTILVSTCSSLVFFLLLWYSQGGPLLHDPDGSGRDRSLRHRRPSEIRPRQSQGKLTVK